MLSPVCCGPEQLSLGLQVGTVVVPSESVVLWGTAAVVLLYYHCKHQPFLLPGAVVARLNSQITEHPETGVALGIIKCNLSVQALSFCFRAGGLTTGILQGCFLGQQILPQLFDQAKWHLLNAAAIRAAVAAMQSFCWWFSSSILNSSKQLYSHSCKVRIRPALLTTFPGSLEPEGGLGAPVPPRKALLSAAMAARSGRAAMLLRRGPVLGLSPVPRRYLYKKKWVRTGGSSALVFFPPIRLRCASPIAPPFSVPISSSLPPQLCYFCTLFPLLVTPIAAPIAPSFTPHPFYPSLHPIHLSLSPPAFPLLNAPGFGLPAPSPLGCLSPKATTSPRIPATRLALHHFDTTYSLQLQERWPAVRAAMLCEQKYGALLNNFASADLIAQQLELLSATDFVSEAARRARCWQESEGVEVERRKTSLEGSGGDGTMVPTETSPLLHASASSNIKCYTFPRGDISRFHPAW